MDTRTGTLYQAVEVHELLGREGLDSDSPRQRRRARDRASQADEARTERQQELLRAAARGELVPVSETVATQVRLGQREQDRRRRRKATTKARRVNR